MYRMADGERRVLPLDAPDSPTTTCNLFAQRATPTASSDAAPAKPKPRSKTPITQTAKSSRRLPEEDDAPDVALHADGCAVAVHQSVLQLRCPWLYKQLRQLRHAPERVQHDGFGLELKLLDEQELQALKDGCMSSCSKCPLQDTQALRLDYVRCAVHRCRGGQNKVDARAQEDSPVVVQHRKRLRYCSTDENQPPSGQLSVPKRARSLFGEVDVLNRPGVLHVKVEGAEIGEIVAVVEYIYRYKVRLLDERKAMRAVKLGQRLGMRSTMIYYFLCVAIRHVTTKTWMDMLVVASTLDEAVMRRLLCKSLLAFVKALKPEQYCDVLVDMNCYRISRLKHRDILIRAVVGLINGVRLLEFWRNLLNGLNRWICDQFKTMEQPPSLRVMHQHFAPEWKPYMERKPVNLQVMPGKGNLFTLLQFGKFQLQVRVAITDEMPILWRIIRSSSPQLLTTDPDELEDPVAFDADPHFWIRAQLKVKYWRAQPNRAEVRHEIFLEYQHCREQYSEWFELVPPSPESLAPAITAPAIQPECPGKAQFRGKFFVWGDPVCSLYHFLLHTTLFYSAPVGAPTEFSDLVVVSEMQRLPVETLVLVLRSDRLRVPEGERTLLRCLNILVFGKDFDRFGSLSQKERGKYNGHAKDVSRLYKCVRWCFVPIDDIIITLRRSPRELQFYELIEKGLQDTFRRFLRRRPWGWRKYRHPYMKNETNVVEFRIEAGDNELSPDDFPPLPKPEPSSQSSLILSPEAIYSDPPRVKSMS